jgi:hypothetical protein
MESMAEVDGILAPSVWESIVAIFATHTARTIHQATKHHIELGTSEEQCVSQNVKCV